MTWGLHGEHGRERGPDGSRGLGGGRCLRIATGRSAQEGTEKRGAVSTGWEDRPGLPSARGGGDSWRGLGRCWRKCLPVCPSPAAAAQGPCGNSSHRPARTRHQKLAGRRALSSCISGGPDAAVGRNRAPPGARALVAKPQGGPTPAGSSELRQPCSPLHASSRRLCMATVESGASAVPGGCPPRHSHS